MKACYCDESGTGGEPIGVMAGVIVDALRMHVTKTEWSDLLEELSALAGRTIPELHTKDFYPGNGVWRTVPGEQRREIMGRIAAWLGRRKHSVVFSAVMRARFTAAQEAGVLLPELSSFWRFLATHLVLSIQKHHQGSAKTKGHTLLVFDHQGKEAVPLAELVLAMPPWTDTYYSCVDPDERLSHIIDVPYFADSRHVALIQVADYVAFVLRKHFEFEDCQAAEAYLGERVCFADWAEAIADRLIPAACIYPAAGRCPCASTFYDNSPPSARALGRRKRPMDTKA